MNNTKLMIKLKGTIKKGIIPHIFNHLIRNSIELLEDIPIFE